MATSTIGFRGTVGEAEFSRLLGLGTRPVVAGSGDWRVSAVPGNRQVSVAAGRGYRDGLETTTTEATIIDLPAPSGSNGMWYLIVCRRTWGDTRTSEIRPIAGDGITATVAILPPRNYPGSMANTPGVVDDQAIAWAFVNANTTDVQVFDARDQRSGTFPGYNDYVTGADNGYTQNSGTTVNHTSRELVLGARRWVVAQVSCYLNYGTGNVAGSLNIVLDGVAIKGRRFHSRGGIFATQSPTLMFGFYVPEGTHTVSGSITTDASGGPGVGVYDMALSVQVTPN